MRNQEEGGEFDNHAETSADVVLSCLRSSLLYNRLPNYLFFFLKVYWSRINLHESKFVQELTSGVCGGLCNPSYLNFGIRG